MKNILGKIENLSLYNKEGKKVYDFYTYPNGYISEWTYDSNGKELTYKNSDGISSEWTYDSNGKELTYKDSNGYSSEHTYGENDIPLTFKDSHGVSIDFDIPEYTMEELIEKLGNFKIKK